MNGLPPRKAMQDAMKRHGALLSSQYYGDITFRGRLFASVAVMRNEADLRSEDGGLVDQSELIIHIAKNRLTEAPRRLEQLLHGGEQWTIRRVAGTLDWEQDWVLTVSK